ncbi:MAG: methyltransferase domain-containing protein [Oscillospiraceae bacterium]|jgi:phenylacetate-coenzyme A ligase PaaK-like adenylate-forming protein|nr:methyltransferase domain-containing protein [Oscillospiraceae bacterium]
MTRRDLAAASRHPGGLPLTQRAVRLSGLPPGARILDIGCGDGASVRLLRQLGFDAVGIDERAEGLPYASGEFDCVLMECVLSVLDDPEAALREARRVLTPRGTFILSDVCAADAEEELRRLLEASGFSVKIEEDHTAALVTYAAERGFAAGRAAGYALFIGETIDPLAQWLARKIGSSTPLEAFQTEQLRETLHLAAAHSRFYRQSLGHQGFSGDTARQILARLPFSYPEQLRADPLAFLCVPPSEASRVVTLGTSGTTGAPKRIYFSADELEDTVDFFDYGMRNIAQPNGRAMIFMRGAGVPDGVCDTLTRGLSRFGCEGISFGEITGDADDARRALLESKADCAVGIASQMMKIAALGGEQPRLKTVLLSADNIPAQTIRALEDAWGCEVFSHFGMTETCFGGAVDCRCHSGMHIREPDMIFEIIDPVTGAQLPDGERGEIVLTTLTRRCMPLIRYRTGDISRILTGECPCGCTLKRLDHVEGHA